MATKSGKQDRLWLGGQGERRFVGWLLLVGWLMGQAKLEAEAAAAAATRLSSSLCLRLPARITVLDGGGRASQRKPTQANATRLGTRISLGLLTASANRSDPSVRFANFFSLPILSRVDWPTFFFCVPLFPAD